ncbi:MAG: hypothetical protein P4L93_02745, partial [Coriobacteriia bacterium]|nr:hypothetical protein [Coriobacteriia bacterium]
GLTCATCHSSTDPTVIAAIAAGNATCASCHTLTTPQHLANHAAGLSGLTGCKGSGCHVDYLMTEHVTDRGLTCATCHASTDPTVIAAISAGGATCTTCHGADAGNHASAHTATITGGSITFFNDSSMHQTDADQGEIDVNVTCSMCHGTMNLVSIHGSNCAWCHSGTNPPANSLMGTWAGGCSQGACHPTYHDGASDGHDSIYYDNGNWGQCASCHDFVPQDTSPVDASPEWCGSCHTLADTTPPATTSNAVGSYIGTASITLSATDAQSGVQSTYYRLDGGAPTTVSGALLVPPTDTPSRSLQYWSVDASGNVETAHSVGFTVVPDVTAPVTTSDAKPTYWDDATIHLSALDDATDFGVRTTYYYFDSGPVNSGATAVLPFDANGTHTIHFWSVDYAGNTESLKTATFGFGAAKDFTAPTTTSSFNPAAGANYNANQSITLSPSDNSGGSGVKATYYRVDSNAFTTGTSFTVSGDGLHTFSYYSVDKAGNVESTHVSNQFRIDTVQPVTSNNATNAAPYLGAQTFTLTPTDAGGSGVASTRWQLDSTSGSWTTGTSVAVPAPASGIVTHTIYWYSVDNAGNTESNKSIAVQVTTALANGGTLAAPGAPRLFTVPAGVTAVTADLYGGMGGGTASYGARLRATLTVTPGQTLVLKVGSRGSGTTGGWGGGTGGNGVGTGTGGGGSTSVGVLGGAVLSEAGGGGGSCGTSTGGPGAAYSSSTSGGNQPGLTSASNPRAGGGGGWTGGAAGATNNSPGTGGTSHVTGNVYLTFSVSGNTTGAGHLALNW